MYIKTHMGLEKFEVVKSCNSYDVFVKFCLGNGRWRSVNSIAKVKICVNVSRKTLGVIGAIPSGGLGGREPPQGVDPLPSC